MQFCEYLKLDCSFTSDTNYHRIMEGFGLEELHHQFCSWELTANKSPVLCSKHHSKNCAHRGSVETFCNKHWVWDCLKNACLELILVNKPHSVHMLIKFTYTMLRCCMFSRRPSPHYGTGSDPCTQPLLSSLCPHSTSANSCFTWHSHTECQLANPDER